MKKTTYILTLALLIFFALSANAQTIFVVPNASGSGTSWADAADLASALAAASPNTEIWVKEGTYLTTTCTDCTFNDRNQRFEIPNGVRLYGGFSGNETLLNQRDFVANPTILSGDIDGDGTLANNSFTIIYTQNVNALTVVDGFTIFGGNADQNGAGLGTPPSSGGGWFNLGSTVTGSSHPTIANCRFEGNHAWGNGGGMYNDGSFDGSANPSLTNCVFSGNTSRFGGAGMYNSGSFEGQASPVLMYCVFENNETTENDGGGMFNIGAESGVANPTLTGCTFTENISFHDGGAMYNFGFKGTCNPTVQGCTFDGNSAHAGGAAYNDGTFGGYSGSIFYDCVFFDNHAFESDGGAIYNSGYQGTCSPEMVNCVFESNNSAFAGGAIFSNGVEGVSNPTITNCRFLANVADTYGGAMYNQGKTGSASPNITNCLFANNSALSAGAIYNLGAESGNANAMITNCTFFGNQANVGGAVYCNAGEQGTGTSSPTVRNCIFWENTANDEGDIFRIIWGTPTISHSLVDKLDCDDLYNGNGGFLNCGGGLVFNQNPMFASSASGNFHLLDGSPAIDDGSNDAVAETGVGIDLDSLPRIYNGTVDLGVFEFGSMMGSAPVVTQQPAPMAVCEGETAIFSVSATGGQPLDFQWFKNGDAIAGANENVLTVPAASLDDAATYVCEVTSGTGETVLSEEAVLTVNQPAEVTLSISASQTEICEGEEITLTAEVENGGPFPEFQWFLNGNAFGSNISTFNIDALNDGDEFTCEVVSSADCIVSPNAISNSVAVSVESVLSASLSIAADAEVPCEGQEVTFTANPVNGGNSPSYQWLVNGNLAGDNLPSFSYIPLSGDEVICEMTSSKNCVEINPVNSNQLTIETMENLTSEIVVTPSIDSTFCIGTEVVFTAETEHAGNSPTFEWEVNGEAVGENEPSLTTSSLNDQDEVTCWLTSSLECLTANPVLSEAVVVSVDSCLVSANEQRLLATGISLYPNPTDGKIFVEIRDTTGTFTIQILNSHGQLLLSKTLEQPVTPLVREINLTDFPQGVYYFQIITDTFLEAKRFVVN